MIRRLSARSIVLGIVAPVAALAFAALVSAAILAATGHNAIDVFHAMFRSLWPEPRPPRPRNLRTLANSINRATTAAAVRDRDGRAWSVAPGAAPAGPR